MSHKNDDIELSDWENVDDEEGDAPQYDPEEGLQMDKVNKNGDLDDDLFDYDEDEGNDSSADESASDEEENNIADAVRDWNILKKQ